MRRATGFILPMLLSALMVIGGCGKKEEKATTEVSTPAAQSVKKAEARVIIPDEVKGKWKAVKVAVLDKEINKEQVYTIEIGSEITLPDAGLTLRVKNFLPAFIMDGTTMTSASNETRNPAAQITISEGGKEVFKGWLFTLYPGTHAFQHPRYSFTLVDFIPVSAEKG